LLWTGQPKLPALVAKTTKLIRAAYLSSKTYLEAGTDVDAFLDAHVAAPKAELIAAIRAGHAARIQ
jgi:hypothetical protein